MECRFEFKFYAGPIFSFSNYSFYFLTMGLPSYVYYFQLDIHTWNTNTLYMQWYCDIDHGYALKCRFEVEIIQVLCWTNIFIFELLVLLSYDGTTLICILFSTLDIHTWNTNILYMQWYCDIDHGYKHWSVVSRLKLFKFYAGPIFSFSIILAVT